MVSRVKLYSYGFGVVTVRFCHGFGVVKVSHEFGLVEIHVSCLIVTRPHDLASPHKVHAWGSVQSRQVIGLIWLRYLLLLLGFVC